MRVLTYYEQKKKPKTNKPPNTSKQWTHNLTTVRNGKQSRHSEGLTTTGNRARAKCGVEKRNAAQTQTHKRMHVLLGPPLYASLTESGFCLPNNTAVQKYQTFKKKQTHKTCAHTRTHTHVKM